MTSVRTARAALLLISAVVAMLVAMTVPAVAQSPYSTDITFEDGVDLDYEIVYENIGTAGFVSPTQVASAITGLDVAPDGTLYFAELNGGIRAVDATTGVATLLGVVSTSSQFCVTCAESAIGEAGIHGFALAHDFAESNALYVSYAVAGSSCEVPSNIDETGAGCYHLSRFTVERNALGLPSIDVADEDVLLSWPFSRYPAGSTRTSAHHGGGIEVLEDGSIVIAVGDQTSPEAHDGYGPRDPGNWVDNGERTSQNPADRRGGLLRVNADGSVPTDNPYLGQTGDYLFGGEVAYDPYVLAKGMRNPYRVVADPVTGSIYSGQVGPDAAFTDPALGPAGQEELNVQQRTSCADGETCPYAPFNGGYPRCIANALPYTEYDFATGTSLGEPLDCSGFDHPVLWYPKLTSDATLWPQLKGSGSTILPGAVYRHTGEGALAPLQDSLLLFDWSRGWLARVPVTDDGTLDVSVESVDILARGFNGAIDAAVAPDGTVYVAEHGPYASISSRIGRICADCGDALPLPTPAAPSSNATAALLLLPLIAAGAVLRRRHLVA